MGSVLNKLKNEAVEHSAGLRSIKNSSPEIEYKGQWVASEYFPRGCEEFTPRKCHLQEITFKKTRYIPKARWLKVYEEYRTYEGEDCNVYETRG